MDVAHFEPSRERPGWNVTPDGQIDFVAKVLNSSDPLRASQPVFDLGSCRVGRGSVDVRADGVIAGRARVYADWHIGFDDDARRQDVIVRGTVKRLRAYRPVYAPRPDQPRVMERREYEGAVDVESTQARTLGLRGFDVLIDLEV